MENKRYFKDFYGCSACISRKRNGKYNLKVSAPIKRIWDKDYATYSGARIAMGKLSDGWWEVTRVL